MKKVFALVIVVGVMLSCITPIFANTYVYQPDDIFFPLGNNVIYSGRIADYVTHLDTSEYVYIDSKDPYDYFKVYVDWLYRDFGQSFDYNTVYNALKVKFNSIRNGADFFDTSYFTGNTEGFYILRNDGSVTDYFDGLSGTLQIIIIDASDDVVLTVKSKSTSTNKLYLEYNQDVTGDGTYVFMIDTQGYSFKDGEGDGTYDIPTAYLRLSSGTPPVVGQTGITSGSGNGMQYRFYPDGFTVPYETQYSALSYLDYLLVIPSPDREYDSWKVKVSVQESTPMGDYWKYLNEYTFNNKNAWKFDKTSPSWQGRDKYYKFDITYILNGQDVSSSVIEPDWDYIEESKQLVAKFNIKNSDFSIQLNSSYPSDYSVVMVKTLAPTILGNTPTIPVKVVDDVFTLGSDYTTIYQLDKNEVGRYYELYIMDVEKKKLFAKYNWVMDELQHGDIRSFDIWTPLKHDVVSLVSGHYGSEYYEDVTPDVVLDGNGDFVVSADPLDSAIDGLSSIKSSILGANTLMLSVVDMLTGYPLVATGVLMMSGVMVILVAVVIVKIFK